MEGDDAGMEGDDAGMEGDDAGMRSAPAGMEGATMRRYHPPMPLPAVRPARLVRAARAASAIRFIGNGKVPAGGGQTGSLAAETAAGLLAILLYLPTLGYGFVFDDLALIAADGRPLALGGILPYRPLRYASYLVDQWLGGTAVVYHADNVLLHGLVAALVVALARRLGTGRTAALAAGLLVAFHPLSVEAAAYVAGRRDLLCVAFGLLALLAHRSGRIVAATALLVLSASAKESGLVFAAPLAAMTLAGIDGHGASRRPVVAAGAIAAAAATGLALVLSYGAIGPWIPSMDAAGLALPGRVAAHYAGSLLGLHALSPEYPQLLDYVRHVRGGDWQAACAGAAASALLLVAGAASVVACVRARRRRVGGEAAFLFAWTTAALAALAVWGGLHEPGADRHAYLLLPPVAVSSAALLSHLRLAHVLPQRAALAMTALVLTLLAAGSRSQMERWRSDRSLWTHAAAGASPSPRTHSNLARVLAADGDYAAAARHLDLAIAADPADPLLYLGRAAVHCADRRPARARRDLQQARAHGASAHRVSQLALECPLPAMRIAAGRAA